MSWRPCWWFRNPALNKTWQPDFLLSSTIVVRRISKKPSIVCWHIVVKKITLSYFLLHGTFGQFSWVTAGVWILIYVQLFGVYYHEFTTGGIFHPHFATEKKLGFPPKISKNTVFQTAFNGILSRVTPSLPWNSSQVRNQLARDDGNDASSRTLQNFWFGSLAQKVTLPETNSKSPWKWMVGKLLFFWDGLFSGANC